MSRRAFNFYESYYRVMKELNDKQKVEFIDTLMRIQFLDLHIDNVKFKDKMLTIIWNAVRHSVQKQIEGYCNSKKIAYSSLFCDVSDAYEAVLRGASIQGEGEVQGEGQEKGQVKGGTNASLRFADISLKSKNDSAKHAPRKALFEFENKYPSEEESIYEMASRFIKYRDEMYTLTKDKKYAVKTLRSIVGFLESISSIQDVDKAFGLMENNEWATFKQEWIKGEI